jgi:hypothetical protein
MRSLFCAGVASLAMVVAATGCGSKTPEQPPGEGGSAVVSTDTVSHAEADLANPPPVYATQASSLAGVATWSLRRGSGSPDSVIEGRDAAGQTVVLVAEAYGAPSDGVGVAYWSDSRLQTTFEAVRAAIARDLVPAAGGVQPQGSVLDRDQEQVEYDEQDLLECMGRPLGADCAQLTTCPDGPYDRNTHNNGDKSWLYSSAYVIHPDPEAGGVDEYCYQCEPGNEMDKEKFGDCVKQSPR